MYTTSTSSASVPTPTLSGVLDRLFPSAVVGVLALIGDGGSPHAEERRAVAGAGERRRREFLSGRACAHAALAAMGRDEGPVAVGPGRQPVWPPGVVGSISHAGDWAGAVVARAEAVRAIGFDLEPLDPPLAPDVERLVGTPADPTDPYRSKVAFSAKECVYKCLFPATGWALEFGDVAVDLDPTAGRFTARVANRSGRPRLEGHPGLIGAELHGRLVVDHGYLFTGLCILRDGALTG